MNIFDADTKRLREMVRPVPSVFIGTGRAYRCLALDITPKAPTIQIAPPKYQRKIGRVYGYLEVTGPTFYKIRKRSCGGVYKYPYTPTKCIAVNNGVVCNTIVEKRAYDLKPDRKSSCGCQNTLAANSAKAGKV